MTYINEEFLINNRLTIGNVMEYFKSSPFYQLSNLSQSQVSSENSFLYQLELAQENRREPIKGTALSSRENLSKIISPGLAIINKVLQIENGYKLIDKYYIINGTIFIAPTLYGLISSKLRSSLFHIQQAVSDVYKMFKWSPQRGFETKVASGETETSYVFKLSELKAVSTDTSDEFVLQNHLLDTLLSEIGIPIKPE